MSLTACRQRISLFFSEYCSSFECTSLQAVPILPEKNGLITRCRRYPQVGKYIKSPDNSFYGTADKPALNSSVVRAMTCLTDRHRISTLWILMLKHQLPLWLFPSGRGYVYCPASEVSSKWWNGGGYRLFPQYSWQTHINYDLVLHFITTLANV